MAITTSTMLKELYTKTFAKGKFKKAGKGKSSTRRKKKK